jgi:hypothetical protein
MENPEFPPNSEVSKQPRMQDKNIEQVTSGGVTRKKKSLRKQFQETFIAGDAKSALRYVVFEILLSSARDMIADAAQGGIEKMLYGDSRRYRGITRPQSGDLGYVAYNRYSQQTQSRLPSAQRAMSRLGRARHDFDEIVLDNRSEAEDVIDRLYELVSRYGSASVADLYELVGLGATHTDNKWGWTDLQGAGVSRIRGGFLLDLPDPEPL